MNIKNVLLVCLSAGVCAIGAGLAGYGHIPVFGKMLQTEKFGKIEIARPLWGSKGLTLVFVDTRKFPAEALAQRLAANNVNAAVIDADRVFKGLSAQDRTCLDGKSVGMALSALVDELPKPPGNRVIVAGIAEGALIPFLNAQYNVKADVTNLSIGFSVKTPEDLVLCQPLAVQQRAAPVFAGHEHKWRAIWTDEPADETAVFIRTLGNIDTRIAAYDTPPDTLLSEELKDAFGTGPSQSPPMPVVEVRTVKPSETLTLFYSGDGGWRDLDRAVAGEMAARNYPVAGVDVLRYFWEHKTPEQAAVDLTATMDYYRKNWGVKFFVLAGYSFGADILPALYNRLSQQDQAGVRLLVLLALARQADFEIHVSGWLGKAGGEHPLAPELLQIPAQKILCVYGREEKSETACTTMLNSEAKILELPGGHHFDEDYPKLTRQILEIYQQHGIQ